jgi:hypothetical protein
MDLSHEKVEASVFVREHREPESLRAPARHTAPRFSFWYFPTDVCSKEDLSLGLALRAWLRALLRSLVDATFRPHIFLARWDEPDSGYLSPKPLLAVASADLGLLAWILQRAQTKPEITEALGTPIGPVGDAALDIAYSLFALLTVWSMIWTAKVSARWLRSTRVGWTPAFKVVAFASNAGIFWNTPLTIVLLLTGSLASLTYIVIVVVSIAYTTYGFATIYALSKGRALAACLLTFTLPQVITVLLVTIAAFITGVESATT